MFEAGSEEEPTCCIMPGGVQVGHARVMAVPCHVVVGVLQGAEGAFVSVREFEPFGSFHIVEGA